jgi:hypothetical protein
MARALRCATTMGRCIPSIRRWWGIALLGEWLMTFLGAAREKMDEETALQTLAATDALLRCQAANLSIWTPPLPI